MSHLVLPPTIWVIEQYRSSTISMFGGMGSGLISSAAQPPPGTQLLVIMSQIVPAPPSLSPAQLPGSRQVPTLLQNWGALHAGSQPRPTLPPLPLLPPLPVLLLAPVPAVPEDSAGLVPPHAA